MFLNKNSNCYNIEKYFKYSTAISMFCEHITIFRTLSIDIWQLKCLQRQTKQKNAEHFFANFSDLQNFSSPSFWETSFWNQKLFLLIASARRSCYTLVRPFPMLSCFPFSCKLFLELIFATKIKIMLLKKAAVLFTSCQKNIACIICLNT